MFTPSSLQSNKLLLSRQLYARVPETAGVNAQAQGTVASTGTHAQAQAKIHAQAHAEAHAQLTTGHRHFPGMEAQIVIIYDELELLWQLTW